MTTLILATAPVYATQTLIEWIADQDTKATHKLLVLAYMKPVVGTNDWDEIVDRDPVIVQAEQRAKAIAQDAGIQKTNTLGQMDTKLRAMIAAAAAADKPVAIYNANMFWTAYFLVRTTDGSGDPTYVIHHHDPIYGLSPVAVNGWGNITGDDIEAALRKK